MLKLDQNSKQSSDLHYTPNKKLKDFQEDTSKTDKLILKLNILKQSTFDQLYEKFANSRQKLVKNIANMETSDITSVKEKIESIVDFLEDKKQNINNDERMMKAWYKGLLSKINLEQKQVEKQLIQESQKKNPQKPKLIDDLQGVELKNDQQKKKNPFKFSLLFSIVGMFSIIFQAIYTITKKNQLEKIVSLINKCSTANNDQSATEQATAQGLISDILNYKFSICTLILAFLSIIIPPFVQKYGDKISSKCLECWRSLKDCLGITNAVANQMSGS